MKHPIEHVVPAASLVLVLGLLASGCRTTPADPPAAGIDSEASGTEVAGDPASASAAINEVCPRSGRPVAEDSLTEYRSQVVGFCNPHCRDDFAAHVADRPRDRRFFDALIEQAGLDPPESDSDDSDSR